VAAGAALRSGARRFSSWILSVTRFAAIDRLRQEGRRPAILDLSGDDPDRETALEQLWQPTTPAGNADSILRLLLSELPAEQRQVVELAYFGDCPTASWPNSLGLPLGTVKGRLRLGLERLRGSGWTKPHQYGEPQVSTLKRSNVSSLLIQTCPAHRLLY